MVSFRKDLEDRVQSGSRRRWHTGRLREPNIAAAWARWDFDWEAKPGKYIIRVRATDEKGNTQPDRVAFNEQGYLYNAIVIAQLWIARSGVK